MAAEERRPIPLAVWGAVASLLVAFAAVALLILEVGPDYRPGWGQNAFAAVLGALVLVGILRSSRLAWLWGRALSAFLGVVQAVTFGVGLFKGAPYTLQQEIVVPGLVAALLAAFFFLGRRPALAFFDLHCPRCGTACRLGADFLFRRARCRRCGEVW